jgi:integration host factor subunit beta
MTKHPTLTKADLIEEVLRISELPRKESETIVETIFESIIDALQKGDKIEIRGFGSFRTRQRRGRIGRNPKTGAKVDVPPKKIPFFKPSKELKDFVNNSASDVSEGGATAASAAPAGSVPGDATHS